MLTPDDVHHGRARQRIEQRLTHLGPSLGPAPGAIRPGETETAGAPRNGLDQPAEGHPYRGRCSVHDNPCCLNGVDRFRTSTFTRMISKRCNSANTRSKTPFFAQQFIRV